MMEARVLTFGLADREAVNVKAAARKEPRDLREHAVSVLDQHRKNSFHSAPPHWVLFSLSTSQTMSAALSQARKASSVLPSASLLSQWK